MIRKIAAAAGAGFLIASGSPVLAVDGVSIELGRGEDRTSLLRVALQRRWSKDLVAGEDWRVGGYWDLSAGVWDNAVESTADVGLTPVFRFERARIYAEAAIGLHLVQAQISAARTFSTAFQFGDHAGMGIREGKFELGLHLQHLSNAGIKRPNPGINFLLMRLRYALQ